MLSGREAAFFLDDGDIESKLAQRKEIMIGGEESHMMHVRQGREKEIANGDGLFGVSQSSPEIPGSEGRLPVELKDRQVGEGAIEFMHARHVFHAPTHFK